MTIPAAGRAAVAGVLVPPSDGAYEERTATGFRIRVRSIAVGERPGYEWTAVRRGFVQAGPSRGMQLKFDSADVLGRFAEALHQARAAAVRMAGEAGWTG